MARLTIDGIAVEVAPGATVLEAATAAGVEIPTLCHCAGIVPRTACKICTVKDTASGRMLTACAAAAEEGMLIETASDEIADGRREVLQLLLSEHTGDCEAPCHRTCPASMNIPYMLRLIQRGEVENAARVAKCDLILPATLGYVCTAPCEKACRRATVDEALEIRALHRQVSETLLSNASQFMTPGSATGKRVAVIGSGAAGLAAAWELRRMGHACVVHDPAAALGGSLRGFAALPAHVLDAEIGSLRGVGVAFELASPSTADELLASGFDAVVVAVEGAQPGGSGVFVAKTEAMPVREVAHGKHAAAAADAHVRAETHTPAHRFDSRMHRLNREEAVRFAENRIASEALARGRCADVPREEAERCLHCDCAAPSSCKLRRYATEYGAKGQAYGEGERLALDRVRCGAGIVYEPGKCIRCGLCVEIARQEGEPLGVGFVGRGFNVRVDTPLNAPLEAALQRAARRCAEACPTAALTLFGQEEYRP